jgi:hypothetical protein
MVSSNPEHFCSEDRLLDKSRMARIDELHEYEFGKRIRAQILTFSLLSEARNNCSNPADRLCSGRAKLVTRYSLLVTQFFSY